MPRLASMTFALFTLWALGAPGASAQDAWRRALDNDYYRVSLDLRARVELADREGLESSRAYTLRTRLGLGTKPFHGIAAFAEVENVFSLDAGQYFDTVHAPNGRTPIADPQETELNRLWLQYENPNLAGAKLAVGRRRFILDDARFVGNVGWRQNEQTFDMVLAQSSLGVEGLRLTYAWIEEAHRIFGDDGSAAQKDFDSDSHVVHASYTAGEGATLSVFAYLLDFENAPANSSDSYGFRLHGAREIAPSWTAGYAGSWAFQTDAAANPVDYEAHYVNAEASLGHSSLGTLAVGYELLGSDDGAARFATPLATAHKFNGFADVFLDNGGLAGLQDAYVSFAPRLPLGLEGKLFYHRFWSDEGGRSLGHEVDFVVSRELTRNLTVLFKGAWFEGTSHGPADLWRFWLDLTFRY